MKKQILTSELEKRKKPKFQINSITYKNNKINVYPVKDKTGKVTEVFLINDVIKIIDRLDAKRKYWELKYKELEERWKNKK